jgi:hypothetical protein
MTASEPEETRGEADSHRLPVKVPLTAGEWASLRENAAYLKTSVGGLIGWIVSEDIRAGASPTRPPGGAP